MRTWSEEVECTVIVILVDICENVVDLRANLLISTQNDNEEPIGRSVGETLQSTNNKYLV